MRINQFLFYTALLSEATLCGCSGSDVVLPTGVGNYYLCAEGERSILVVDGETEDGDFSDEDIHTRSLFIGGAAGTNYIFLWDRTDVAKVYKDGEKVGVLQPVSLGDQHSELTGTLEGCTCEVGDELLVYMPSLDMTFTGQDGTLSKLSTEYCHWSCSVHIKSIQDGMINTDPIMLMNRHSYAMLKFRDDQTKVYLHVKQLTIHAESGKLVTYRGADGYTEYGDLVINLPLETNSNDYPNIVYVALLNEKEGQDSYTYTIVDKDGKKYTGKSAHKKEYLVGDVAAINRNVVCVSVDLGLQTGITPPENNDVGGENVTPAEE